MDMQAIRIHSYGAPDVMQLETLPIPVPQAGQALVRVYAASVNFLDVMKRRGDLAQQNFYKQAGITSNEFPAQIGSQGVGTVEAIGPDVTNLKIGDRVSFGGNGTYATYTIIDAAKVFPIPDSITFEQAAGGLNQGFLAYALTHAAYPVKQGDWCLMQAAAGGIGLLLCQMAKMRGGKVIGVVSSAEKVQAAKDAGADEVIISTQSNIAKEVRSITGGRGVNVVYDGVGKDTFEAGLDSLARRGYMMVYGQASGYVPPLDIMTLQDKGSLFLSRFSGYAYFEEWYDYIRDFEAWVGQGKLSIHIDSTYPLKDAALAHAAFEGRKTIGRVLLLP